ncbi:MAG: U32 family peptidase C-terminal domain-containing protein, partial [Erysipelotrichaceae bacterium]
LDYDQDSHMATIEVRNHFSIGEEVEVFGPKLNNEGFIIKKLMDEDGNCVEVANNPMKILKIEIPFEVHQHDMIRKRRD